MPFSERTKHIAKSRAAFRCCVCNKPFVEVHHLIPQSEGGSDELENAAPLCASCHDLYGGNPEKRKILTQMRDHWWELMQEQNAKLTDPSQSECFEIAEDQHFKGGLHKSAVAIFHVVFAEEDFETAASTLFKLICEAQTAHPNRRRHLYLEIEGHRNENGGFDSDMFELQRHFLMGFLGRYLTELHIPLMAVQNNKLQLNNVPSDLSFLKEDFGRKDLVKAIDDGVEKVWLAKRDLWLDLPKSKNSTQDGRLRRHKDQKGKS
jgi:hypothetical protein